MAKITKREIKTYKQVFPDMCNPNIPQMFGGALFSLMDEVAHTLVTLNLHGVAGSGGGTPCDGAVTHTFTGSYVAEPRMGDLLKITASVKEVRTKGIGIDVVVHVISRDNEAHNLKVAECNIGFVTKSGDKFTPHRLEM